MNNSAYSASAHGSSSSLGSGPPKSIAELAAIAQHNLWDPKRPLKHWLRTAEKARKAGNSYVEDGNYEAAFIEFARAATIVLERLPTHSEYHALLNADQRANLGMVSCVSCATFTIGEGCADNLRRIYLLSIDTNCTSHLQNGQDILDGLSKLKPHLVERYETYRRKHGIEDGPSQVALDTDPREETARRRREEHQRVQEEERVRHALESAHIEDDWRRSDIARREADDLQRRVQEERDWARQPKESRQVSDAQRAAEAREAAQQERASRLRLDEEARRQAPDEEERMRRRASERRRAEQEGILRRQHEADAAAMETRRQIANTSNTSGQPMPDAGTYYRRSQEPETSARTIGPRDVPRPVATSQPSRPPSSSQQRSLNAPYVSGPPMMPLESSVVYDEDIDANGRAVPWSHSRQAESTSSKANRVNPA